MKNFVTVFIAVLMCSGIYAGEKNLEKEKEAIIQVITESTNAYRARDFEKISTTFVHDASTIKTGAAKGGFLVRSGWEEIAANYKNSFTTSPTPITRNLDKTNFRVKVYKESGWAIHDESQILEDGTISKQIITHFLEKHDGKWKIVYMSQIFVSSYDDAE
jgi:ketosteroid isomerase-like protein